MAAEETRRNALYQVYRAFSKHFGLQEQINRVYYSKPDDLVRNASIEPAGSPASPLELTGNSGKGDSSKEEPEPFKDITDEYFPKEPVQPGKVTADEDYLRDETHDKDRKTAEWFAKNAGMDVHLLKERTGEHVHTPDAIINGKQWEFKNASAKSSINSRIADAMQQILENPGGLIINITANHNSGEMLSDEKAFEFICDKLKFYQKHLSLDVIVKSGDRVIKAIRMKKRG